MKDKAVSARHELHVCNGEINKKQGELSKIEDYVRVMHSIVPLVELAHKMCVKLDIDEGQTKKTWQMILADVMTIKREVEDYYSDKADGVHELEEKIVKLRKEIDSANL